MHEGFEYTFKTTLFNISEQRWYAQYRCKYFRPTELSKKLQRNTEQYHVPEILLQDDEAEPPKLKTKTIDGNCSANLCCYLIDQFVKPPKIEIRRNVTSPLKFILIFTLILIVIIIFIFIFNYTYTITIYCNLTIGIRTSI
jgi:hypothetical protein